MNTSTDNEYKIRHAKLQDVPEIYSLLKHYSDQGILLPRPQSDIYGALRDFYVAQYDGKIIACAALLIYTKELGEIRSLAVDTSYMKLGLGNKIVQQIEQDAKYIGLTKLMALTYVVNFFEKLDFKVVEMSELPEKVWGACINCHKFQNCDEIAMLKYINKP